MTTFTSSAIASWSNDQPAYETTEMAHREIATEGMDNQSALWQKCFDALLYYYSHPSDVDDGLFTPPNTCSVCNAMEWLKVWQINNPTLLPTRIGAEPSGGIIIERRETVSNGDEVIFELTTYNNGVIEITRYLNGRVVDMNTITPDPSRLH